MAINQDIIDEFLTNYKNPEGLLRINREVRSLLISKE